MSAAQKIGIPESQLATWSHQGAVQSSSATYTSIKTALERGQCITDKKWTSFLQGSYANNTNIRGDSDVDVVCRLDSTFYRDLNWLPEEDKELYKNAFTGASYGFTDFKRDVIADLKDYYGEQLVDPGGNAVWVKATNGRLNADVVVCCQHRRYRRFRSMKDQDFLKGITFWRADGTQIINYPRQHLAACTQKHQDTNKWFKPMVRIVKNIKGRMVDDGLITDDVAPSYFLEGLLWNAPKECYGSNFHDSIVAVYNDLINATDTQSAKWRCPNGVYDLFGSRPEQWRKENCLAFLRGFKIFWDNY